MDYLLGLIGGLCLAVLIRYAWAALSFRRFHRDLVVGARRAKRRDEYKAGLIKETKLTKQRKAYFKELTGRNIETAIMQALSDAAEEWQRTVDVDYVAKSEWVDRIWKDATLTLSDKLYLLRVFRQLLTRRNRHGENDAA